MQNASCERREHRLRTDYRARHAMRQSEYSDAQESHLPPVR